MCPLCIATATLTAAAGASSVGSVSAWIALRLRSAQRGTVAIRRRGRVLLLGLLLAAPVIGAALIPALPRAAAVVETRWRRTFAAAARNGDPSDPVEHLLAIAGELVEGSAQ